MLCALALAAEMQATLAVADRTEVRVRSTQSDPTGAHVDAATIPSVRLRVLDRRVEYSLGYLPTLTMPDLQDGHASPEVLHAGFAGVSWRADRRVRLSLVEDGSYGDRNFGYLTTAPAAQGQTTPPPVQALPGVQTIRFGSSRTALLTQVVPARKWTLSTSLAYSISGGMDEASRVVVPLQRGPRADVIVDHRLTRLDRAFATIGAFHTDFGTTRCSLDPAAPTCSPDIEMLDSTGGWARRLARDTELTLAAGAATVRARHQPNEAYALRSYPVAVATLTDLFRSGGDHGLTRLDVRLSPVVDFRTGTVDQRAQATAALAVTRHRTTLRLGASFAQSMPPADPGGVTLFGGDAEILYKLSTRFDLSTGARATWQHQSPVGTLFTRLAFVAVTFHEPPLRL